MVTFIFDRSHCIAVYKSIKMDPGKKSKHAKKTKVPQSKLALYSPFEYKWPKLISESEKDIVDCLKSAIEMYNLSRPCRPYFKNKQDRKDYRESHKSVEVSSKHLRSQLVTGLNNVTRLLEKRMLRLVFVSHDSELSTSITDHLIPLSQVTDCICVAIKDFNKQISSSLNMKSVAALGFKKVTETESQSLNEIVEQLSKKIQAATLDERSKHPTHCLDPADLISCHTVVDDITDSNEVIHELQKDQSKGSDNSTSSHLFEHFANSEQYKCKLGAKNSNTCADELQNNLSTTEVTIDKISDGDCTIDFNSVDVTHLLVPKSKCGCSMHIANLNFISLLSTEEQIHVDSKDQVTQETSIPNTDHKSKRAKKRYFLDTVIQPACNYKKKIKKYK